MYKERIEAMRVAYAGDEDILNMIKGLVSCAATYCDSVVDMENQIPDLRIKHSEDSGVFKAIVEDLDKRRRRAHNALISSVTSLERFFKAEGHPPIFEGNQEDRIEIADFAIAVFDEYFEGRQR